MALAFYLLALLSGLKTEAQALFAADFVAVVIGGEEIPEVRQ